MYQPLHIFRQTLFFRCFFNGQIDDFSNKCFFVFPSSFSRLLLIYLFLIKHLFYKRMRRRTREEDVIRRRERSHERQQRNRQRLNLEQQEANRTEYAARKNAHCQQLTPDQQEAHRNENAARQNALMHDIVTMNKLYCTLPSTMQE
jgi:hypothetical protein